MRDTELLAGQVAIVTGGAQGIGLSIGQALLEHGARVVIADIGKEHAEKAARSLGGTDKVVAVPCNVTVADEVDSLIKASLAAFGRVDIVVNNAGVTRDAYIGRMSEADFDAVLGVSLKGAWLLTRAVSALFRQQKSGSIINLSSMSGKIGNPGQTNYSAAKAGVVGLTKAAAKEFGPSGVRVNAVMPGLIRTEMTMAMKPEVFAAREKDIPLQRAGEPAEVANAVVFLASGMASYITGAVIEVGGGRGI